MTDPQADAGIGQGPLGTDQDEVSGRSTIARAIAGAHLNLQLRERYASTSEPIAMDGYSTGSLEVEGTPYPSEIGPYKVLECLGTGGMGAVYLARRTSGEIEREVALKVISGGVHDATAQRRFRAEQNILSRLEHPNLARLYEVGVGDSANPYFAMEYIDGIAIDAYCDLKRLPLERRLDLMAQVMAALSYAHRSLVVHRDVKPSNILVTDGGTVKLLDFGVAKLLTPDAGLLGDPPTRLATTLLTPEYASPEQLRGETVSTATDVYAAGVLLYELLTGTRPHDLRNRSPIEIERVVTQKDARPPSTRALTMTPHQSLSRSTTPSRLSRALKGDLDAILLTALSKEPQRRYGNIDQFAADLNRYHRREPVRARPPTLGYRALRFAARKRAPITATGLVVLALGSGLFATLRQAHAATLQAERADRVKGLLIGLFEGTDPDLALGRRLSALELLDRGAGTLVEGLEGEPLITAELQQILGTIYGSLGEYDKAAPLLQAALSLRDESGDAAERAAVRTALADLLYLTGELDRGEQLAREALELTRVTHPSQSHEVADAITGLASFIRALGRFDEAEELLQEALTIGRRERTPALVARNLNALGGIQAQQGKYDEAIPAFEEALKIRRTLHAGDHTEVSSGLYNLAWAHQQKGEFERADSLYELTKAMRLRLYGDGHPRIATVLNNQGNIRYAEARWAESEALHNQALQIRLSVFGEEHVEVASSRHNLALIRYSDEDFIGAEEGFRESLRVFRLHRQEDHPSVLNAVNNLGLALRAQGRLDEAEQLLRATLERRVAVLGPDHPKTGGTLLNLSGILRRRQRYREAEAPARRALEIFKRGLDHDHRDLARGRLNLGKILVALERGAESVDDMREACRSGALRYEDHDPFMAECRAILALALIDAGSQEEALELLEHALPVLVDKQPNDVFTEMARQALHGS